MASRDWEPHQDFRIVVNGLPAVSHLSRFFIVNENGEVNIIAIVILVFVVLLLLFSFCCCYEKCRARKHKSYQRANKKFNDIEHRREANEMEDFEQEEILTRQQHQATVYQADRDYTEAALGHEHNYRDVENAGVIKPEIDTDNSSKADVFVAKDENSPTFDIPAATETADLGLTPSVRPMSAGGNSTSTHYSEIPLENNKSKRASYARATKLNQEQLSMMNSRLEQNLPLRVASPVHYVNSNSAKPNQTTTFPPITPAKNSKNQTDV